MAGALTRMPKACPWRMASRCVTYTWPAQPLWLAKASSCWWNTVQDTDPSNFGGFILTPLVTLFFPPSSLYWATVTHCISNFQRVISRSHWVTLTSCEVASTSHQVSYSSLLNLQRFWACCWTISMTPLDCLSSMSVQIPSGQPVWRSFQILLLLGRRLCSYAVFNRN